MNYINLNASEFYYLRFLFLHVFNLLSYKDLWTMNGDLLSFFYIVYIIRDLTYNNVEWDEALKETDIWKTDYCLRSLFVIILFNYTLSRSFDLWNKYKTKYIIYFVWYVKVHHSAKREYYYVIYYNKTSSLFKCDVLIFFWFCFIKNDYVKRIFPRLSRIIKWFSLHN